MLPNGPYGNSSIPWLALQGDDRLRMRQNGPQGNPLYLMAGKWVREKRWHPINTSHYALPLKIPKSRVSRAYWSQTEIFGFMSRNKHCLCNYPGICYADGKLTNTSCHLLPHPLPLSFFFSCSGRHTAAAAVSGFFIFPPLYQEKQDLERTSKISRAGPWLKLCR